MRTIESSGAAGSTMEEEEEASQTLSKPPLKRPHQRLDGDDVKPVEEEECCDVEAWETLSKSFKEVQSVLDQNRALIQQVNANHQSKIPDNLAKNVGLIREINNNISKVVGVYSDLGVNFSNIVQQRRAVSKKSDSFDEKDANRVTES